MQNMSRPGLQVGAVSLHSMLMWVVFASCFVATGARGLETVLENIVASSGDYVEELLELVRIPSVSALPSHQQHIDRAASWVAKRLERAGIQNVQTLAVKGDPHPVVYGDFLDSATAPTALLYAHYDVQPADPAELWTTDPFKPEIRAGRLYGRGASDNKAGLLAAVQAVEAILKTDQRLPINLKLLLEGSEEIGSPRLGEFVLAHKELLACDFAISADGRQISATQPGILLGMRGAVALEVVVTALRADVHSGQAGGAVQNPLRAMSQLLASMFHDNSSVAVVGYYDGVQKVTDSDRDDMLAYNFDEEQELLKPLGAIASHGEEGFSTLERIWFRPTLEITGVSGGFAGDGIKTIIPSRAVAKLAARLVPNQDPGAVLKLIEAHIQAHHPPACNVTVRELGFKGWSYSGRRHSRMISAATKVLAEVMGTGPLFFRDGATIPALAIFQQHLGVETLGFGFELASDALHAPDEHVQLSMYHASRAAFVKLIYELQLGAHDASEL